jgi:hypothetical protein
MKQIFSLLGGTTLLLCVCLFACQKANDTTPQSTDTATQTTDLSNTPSEEATERGPSPASECGCGATVRLQATPGYPIPSGVKVRIYRRTNCSDATCTYNPIPVAILTGTKPVALADVSCLTCYTAVGDYSNWFPVDIVVSNINGPVLKGTVYDSNNNCNTTQSLAFSASGTCIAN